MSSLSIYTERIIIIFPLNIKFVTFFRNYFFNSKVFNSLLLFKYCLIRFLQFNSFFTVNVFYYVCPQNSIFITKTSSDQFESYSFAIFLYIFLYSNMVTIFKFRIFIIILYIKINTYAKVYINRLLTYQDTHFLILKWYICKFGSLRL